MKITGPIPPHILAKMDPADRAPLGKSGLLPAEIESTQLRSEEKELQRQIMGWLGTQGIFAGQQRMDKKSNLRPGWADIVLCCHGWPIALEVKGKNGKQTEEQIDAQMRMEADGWKYYVVRSLAEVVRIIDIARQTAHTLSPALTRD